VNFSVACAQTVTHVSQLEHITITQPMLAHPIAVHIAPIHAIRILDDGTRWSHEQSRVASTDEI
jgi:hypothetical protein